MSSPEGKTKPKLRQRIRQSTAEGAKKLFRRTDSTSGVFPTSTGEDRSNEPALTLRTDGEGRSSRFKRLAQGTAQTTKNNHEHIEADAPVTPLDDPAPSGPLKGRARIAWDGFRLLSDKAADILEGTPFRFPVEMLNTVLETASAVEDNDSSVRKALDQINKRLQILNQALDNPRSNVAQDRCEQFSRRLIGVKEDLEDMKKRGILERITQIQEDPKILEDLLDVVCRATEDFQIHVSLTIERNTEDLKDILEKDRLDKLLSHEAIYGSADAPRATCTPGTREFVLKKIRTWASDPVAPGIFWLAGRAGTGKSTIANTIAGEWEKEYHLCPSFFCSRQMPAARMRLNIVPTLASLLARVSSSYRDALLNIDVGPILRRPDKHVEDMIVSPWIKADRAENLPSILIVVDALEELEVENGKSAGAKFIQQFIHHANKLHGLKFLITSRHEPQVVEYCKSLEASYHLEDADVKELRQDIETYLQANLPDLRDHQLMTQLVDQSDGLFIYAATAVRFINVTNVQSVRLEQLKSIIQGWPVREEQEREGLAVDKVYFQILQSTLPSAKSHRQRMLSVLFAILCAQEPLAAATIAALLRAHDENITEGIVKNIVLQLHAVLREDSVSGCVYIYHQSFRDYMLDHERCAGCGEDVVCKPHEQNFLLTQSCFQIMASGLRFNICDLPSSFLHDKQVTDLGQRVKERISLALRYASRRWAFHLAASLDNSEMPMLVEAIGLQYQRKLLQDVEAFCVNYLLFWIEAMNLIGLRGECSKLLNMARESLKISSNQEEEATLLYLYDAENLATSFASNPVSKSTPHLYISLLPVHNGHSALLQTWKNKFKQLPVLEGQRKMERVLSVFYPKRLVVSLDISRDGRYIVAGMEDGTVYVWESTTGEERLKLEGHSVCVTAVSFSFDSKNIVSASWDGTVCVWNSMTGDEKLKLSRHNAKGNASFSLDPKRISLGEKETMRRAHDDLVWSASFSPDGKSVISDVPDRTVRVWDVETGDEKLKLEDHNSGVTATSFSPNGKDILSASMDGTLRIWDALTGNERRKLDGHSREVTAASFSPDNKRIVSAANDCTVRVWDVTTAKEELKLTVHSEYVVAASFSSDGKHIISAGANCAVRVYDAITGEEELVLGHNSVVMTALYSHDGKRIVSATEDKTVRVWDATGKRDSSMDIKGHSDVVTATSFSNDGQRIISASWDRTVRVWDAASGKEVLLLKDLKDKVWDASFSEDGRRIVTGLQDGTVQVWDATMGSEELCLKGHTDFVWAVSFSPDGKYAVSGSFDRTIRLWDLVAGRQDLSLTGHGHYVKTVSFSPDGQCIVSASFDKTVRLWDAATRKEKLRMDHRDKVWAASFSLDGTRIVSGSEDRVVRVWDAVTGQEKLTLKGHDDVVRAVSYSKDGKRIVSASHDGTVRVWDAVTGSEELTFLFGHGVPVTSASFSPDGKRIISAADDSTVRMWDATKGSDKYWTVDDYGWIVSSQGEKLMWVTSDIVQILQQPHCRLINSPYGSVSVNFTNALLGESWTRCYS